MQLIPPHNQNLPCFHAYFLTKSTFFIYAHSMLQAKTGSMGFRFHILMSWFITKSENMPKSTIMSYQLPY